MRLVITFDIPPSTNMLYTNGNNGRRVMTAEGRAFKTHAIILTGHAYAPYSPLPANSHFALSFDVFFADNRRDLTNTIKVLEDSIFKAIGFDDRRVVDFRMKKHRNDPANPRIEVVLELAPDPNAKPSKARKQAVNAET